MVRGRGSRPKPPTKVVLQVVFGKEDLELLDMMTKALGTTRDECLLRGLSLMAVTGNVFFGEAGCHLPRQEACLACDFVTVNG